MSISWLVGAVGIEKNPTPIKSRKQWCCDRPAKTTVTNVTKVSQTDTAVVATGLAIPLAKRDARNDKIGL